MFYVRVQMHSDTELISKFPSYATKHI
jgi:hypothetical protein